MRETLEAINEALTEGRVAMSNLAEGLRATTKLATFLNAHPDVMALLK
jgi:hypothetical protein